MALIFYPMTPAAEIDNLSVHGSCPTRGLTHKFVAQQWIHAYPHSMAQSPSVLGHWMFGQNDPTPDALAHRSLRDLSRRAVPLTATHRRADASTSLCTQPPPSGLMEPIQRSGSFTVSVWIRPRDFRGRGGPVPFLSLNSGSRGALHVELAIGKTGRLVLSVGVDGKELKFAGRAPKPLKAKMWNHIAVVFSSRMEVEAPSSSS